MARFVLLLLPLAGCAGDPCAPEPGVLVVDGGFEHGVECWLTGPSDASAKYSSSDDSETNAPSLQADNGVDGNNEWDTFVNSQGFSLTEGTTYELRFWARSSAPRTLFVGVQECGGTTDGCSDMVQFLPNDHPAIDESWNELTWTFAAPQDGDRVYVTVEFGGDSALVWIDDVEVSEP